MQDEKILSTLASTNPASCLEVAVGTDSQGGRQLELRRLSWGEGIGWYCQQTLSLNADETAGLLQTLRASHFRWRDHLTIGRGTVIPFPFLLAHAGIQGSPRLQGSQKERADSRVSQLPDTGKKRTTRGRKTSATSLV